MTPDPRTHSRRRLLAGLVFPGFLWSRPRTIQVAGAQFEVVRNGRSRWRFLHVHGDETTARDVLREAMKVQKGTAFFIQNDQRNMPAGSGWIDPNRMFSSEGAARSLRRLNQDWSDAQIKSALREIDAGREKLLRELLPEKRGILVALHNNSQGYSMQTEIPISDKVSVKDKAHMFDFLLATDPADFAALEKSPFNVVLQRNPPPPDDGSLSRLCARRGLRYLNIEAVLGNKAEQAAMLDWCLKRLS